MVGAGRYSADFDVSSLADLCELPRAAALFEQRANANAGRGIGGFWCVGCPAGVLLDLVFSNAASAARHRRRRVDGSENVARAADQLDGVPLLRISGVLVAIPAGT